jgi:hypothetical protein
MVRTGSTHLSEREQNSQPIEFDNLRTTLFAVHLAIIAYVMLGWLIPSRFLLYFYTLLLPMIAMQWLLNGGCSIVNNIENLVRIGQWSDPQNEFEGAFFKTFLDGAGIRASQAQITTALCSLMLIFWVCAICRMMLIVSSA